MLVIKRELWFFVMLFFLLIFNDVCFCAETKVMKSSVQILRFDGLCKRSPDTVIKSHLKDKRMDGKYIVLNTTIEVLRDVTDMSFSINIEKCRSKENPDSCQNVYRVHYKNACQFFKIESKLFAPVLTKISPPFQCPLRKGMYTQTNGSFDISPVLFLPVRGLYWRCEVELTDEGGKVLLCLDVLLKVSDKN